MRAVVQRVVSAQVDVNQRPIAQIGCGLLALVAVMKGDGEKDLNYIADKLSGLRVFKDEQGKMNRSVADIGGEILLVSQFTLAGDARHGKRPSFIQSEDPKLARPMIDRLAQALNAQGIPAQTGAFGADMRVTLSNEGPVTILLDSGRLF